MALTHEGYVLHLVCVSILTAVAHHHLVSEISTDCSFNPYILPFSPILLDNVMCVIKSIKCLWPSGFISLQMFNF